MIARELVFKTNSEADSILIVVGNEILYASKGQYGGWIIKKPINTLEDVKALWCYERETRKIDLGELENYAEIKAFLEKVRQYGLEEPNAEEITYYYHPVKVEVKKVREHYTVIDIVPDDSVTITAKAVRLYWRRHYSRKGNCAGALCGEKDREKLELIAKSLSIQIYEIPAGRRDYEIRAKFIVDYSQVEQYLYPSGKEEAPRGREEEVANADKEVHVEELEKELRELHEPEVIEIKPAEPTAVTAQQVQPQQTYRCADEYEKLKREVEELREIVEKRFDEWARRQGLVKLKLIVFRLPTEYLGSKTEYRKTSDGRIIESKILSVNPTVARSLRKRFYDVLHETAFKIYDMWALRHDADIKKLDEIMNVINETFRDILAGERAVTLVDVYFPRDYVINALTKYIEERKATMSDVYEKLNKIEKAREKARLLRELEELKTEIEALESELKYLQSF